MPDSGKTTEIRVKFYGNLSDITKTRSVTMTVAEGSTVRDLLNQLLIRFGEPFQEALEHAAILINGRTIEVLKGLETELNAEDVVMIVPPMAGG